MYSVYFIGAGPGDPELLTLQGAAALKKAAVVYLSIPYDLTFAEYLLGKEILLPFDFNFEDLIENIETQLIKGDVAFLIPGDLTFFSPYQGLINYFADRCQVLAGVGIANAASARLKRTLDLPEVCYRTVIVSPRTLGKEPQVLQIEDLAAPGVTLLIYMNNMPLAELVKKLHKGYGKDVPIALAHRLGLAGESIIVGTLESIVEDCGGVDYFFLDEPHKKPALTLVIVGESLLAEMAGEWWNQKRKECWQQRKSLEEG